VGELERSVLDALTASDRGPLKTKELARVLEVAPAEYRAFRRILAGMERKGTIYRVKGHRYAMAAKLDLVTGVVSVTRDGHGFVRPDRTCTFPRIGSVRR
jgi:exoribonuclease R